MTDAAQSGAIRGAHNPPVIWLLLSDKQGDNKQALAVAAMLDHPYVVKHIYPKARYVLGKPWFRASVRHLDLQRSDPLNAPWPDVLITIGRRPTMAAMWIRQRSANRARIILIGRQPRHLDRFALVISSCQYVTANDPRILRIALPLDTSALPLDGGVTASACTAILVGGPTRTYRLTPADALRLLHITIRQCGDSPLVVLTSRRTPKEVVDCLAANLPSGAQLVPWAAGSPDYQQTLARCGRFVVTGDSISMICDVVRMARPLAIFKLAHRNALVRLWHDAVLALAPIDDGRDRPGVLARWVRRIVDSRLIRLPRSFEAFYAFLFQHRCASDVEQGFLETYAIMREQDHRLVAASARQVLYNHRLADAVELVPTGAVHDDTNS